MAGSSPELVCKTVQELAADGDELPERYIRKEDSIYGAIDPSCPLVEIPEIDISLLTSLSAAGEEELNKLRSALSLWGCFQAINHGMEDSLLDKVREISREFFALPMEEKQRYAKPADDIEGYGNDTVLFENQTLDWTDRLYLLVNPEDQRTLKYWPENPECFREILHEYTKKLRLITEGLLKALARSVNLEERCFLNQYGEQAIMYARFNLYPPCPRPDLVLGLKPHADGSALTFLLQDEEVEGLQLLKDDQWFKVPIIPHALLVNAGDQLEIMSNGIFKSPVHRAVTNSERVRMTIAMFCAPESQMEIGPLEELISNERPRLFRKVSSRQYIETYFKYYQQGQRPINAVKI